MSGDNNNNKMERFNGEIRDRKSDAVIEEI
jgi:hypothetical protein